MTSLAKIAWCVPAPSEGSGGFRTILHNAQALEKHGISSDFYFPWRFQSHINEREIRHELKEWFGFDASNIYVGSSTLKHDYSLCLATSWNTAAWVNAQSCPNKAYFIQDYEPWFYPVGSERLEAESSYQLALTPITIGRFLAQRCRDLGSERVFVTDFGADLLSYRPIGNAREHAICAVYQPEKPRRASELLIQALLMVHQLDPELSIYLFGSRVPCPYQCFEQLGLLSVNECNGLYNRCQVGVSISTTNPSRIPFEMMAAGLPVVDLYGDNTLYDIPESGALLANATPASIASAILELLENEALREKKSREGHAYMKLHPIEMESQQFVDACKRILNSHSAPNEATDSENSKIYTLRAFPPSKTTEMLAQANLASKIEYFNLTRTAFSCVSKSVLLELNGIPDTFHSIVIASWSAANQSDLIWEEASQDQGCWVAKIALASLTGKPRQYTFHIYGLSDNLEDDDLVLIDGFEQEIQLLVRDEGGVKCEQREINLRSSSVSCMLTSPLATNRSEARGFLRLIAPHWACRE